MYIKPVGEIVLINGMICHLQSKLVLQYVDDEQHDEIVKEISHLLNNLVYLMTTR